MQNARNYPMVGSPSISKSHVGPGIQQKPRIWTLISLIIYDFSSAIVLSWGAHVRPLAMIHGQRTLQFFDGLIWRQWSFWHLYVEGYMVRLTQRSTSDSSWRVLVEDSSSRHNGPRSLLPWCKGTHRGIGRRELAMCGAKPSHHRLQNITVTHRLCLCTMEWRRHFQEGAVQAFWLHYASCMMFHHDIW